MTEKTNLALLKGLCSNCARYLKDGSLPDKSAKPESLTQQLFISPLIELLGWLRTEDRETTARYIMEYGIAEKGKRWADYALLIDNTPVVLVEAKQLFEPLDKHVQQLLQQISKFNRENPQGVTVYWGVLTNFQETRVYYYDDPKSPIVTLGYSDYPKELNFLFRILSPDGIRSNGLEKRFRETSKRALDDEFLQDLKRWRIILANGYLKMNQGLSEKDLDTISQRVLDRLILIRVLENSGALPYAWLTKRYRSWHDGILGYGRTFSDTMRTVFREFWNVFDTELFEDAQADEYDIDDEFLKEVIKVSGHPSATVEKYSIDNQSKLETKGIYGYNFGLLDVDVMGSVYERYLSFSIRLMDGIFKYASVQATSGTRKKEGAYYTSTSVVDYIIRTTLEDRLRSILEKSIESLKNKEFAEAHDLIRQLGQIRVLDPAFGSGSFLLRVFDMICDVYEEYNRQVDLIYTNASEIDLRKQFEILQSKVADYPERVLLENIYGVDKDPHALEIAKLNLWSKYLARKSGSGSNRFGSSSEPNPRSRKPLPDLRMNLRNGNSLVFGIAPEYDSDEIRSLVKSLSAKRESLKHRIIARSQNTDHDIDVLLEEEIRNLESEILRISEAHSQSLEGTLSDWQSEPPLNWQIDFPEVFSDLNPEKRGFDYVIGNPPYVNIVEMEQRYRDYFMGGKSVSSRVFESATKRFDLYVLFLELCIHLLKQNGRLGFIVPDKFMYLPYAEPLRKLLLDKTRIVEVFDLSRIKVFPESTVNPAIIVFEKLNESEIGENNEIVFKFADNPEISVDRIFRETTGRKMKQALFRKTPNHQFRFDLANNSLTRITELISSHRRLGDFFYVNWGLRTGTKELTKELITEKPISRLSKKMIRGDDILGRYLVIHSGEYITYDKDKLYNPMFPELFENHKIVIRKISGRRGLFGSYDESGHYCFSTVIVTLPYSIIAHSDRVKASQEMINDSKQYDPKYVLGVINSKPLSFYHRILLYDGIAVTPEQVKSLPIPNANNDVQKKIACFVDELLSLMKTVDSMISLIPSERSHDLAGLVENEKWGVSQLTDTTRLHWDPNESCNVGELSFGYTNSGFSLFGPSGESIMNLSFTDESQSAFKMTALMLEKWIREESRRKFAGVISLGGPRYLVDKTDLILEQIRKKTGNDDLPLLRRRIDKLDTEIDQMVGELFGLCEDDMNVIEKYLQQK